MRAGVPPTAASAGRDGRVQARPGRGGGGDGGDDRLGSVPLYAGHRKPWLMRAGALPTAASAGRDGRVKPGQDVEGAATGGGNDPPELLFGPGQSSRKLRSVRLRLGCFNLRSAFASIWRMRSRVTLNCCPTSSKV